jgi:glucokinase
MKQYICLDVGGTNIRGGLFNENDIQPVQLQKIPTRNDDQKAEDRICELIKSILAKTEKLVAIAIAAPGFVDAESGVVIRAVNIPGWDYLPLKKIIEEKFKIPVFIENDARLAALGEWKYGAAIGHHDLIYLTISTGIGGGVILKDRLLTGAQGMATELGHTTIVPDGPLCSCGQRGHLEAISSGTAIAHFVQKELDEGKKSILVGRKIITSKEIAEAANSGDELSQFAFQQAGTFLGKAVANFLHIFNPSCIVFGGGVSLTGDLLMEPMRKEMEKSLISKEYLKTLEITLAHLGDNAGLLGGMVLINSK